MLQKHGVMIPHVMTKYQHTHRAFIEALNKLLAENPFKVQEVQELNNPEKVLLTWVKHLYGLIGRLNDTGTQMIGMSPRDAIELNKVPLVESYPQKTHCLRMDCITICYNPAKSTTTSAREPLIEYGLRKLTD